MSWGLSRLVPPLQTAMLVEEKVHVSGAMSRQLRGRYLGHARDIPDNGLERP